jgi:S-formylglutathione hydrolase FrmB
LAWHELELESEALRGNPLGDPSTRPLFVWTPPEREAEPERRLPAIYLLHAMTGQARAWFNVAPFEPSLAEQVDALAPEAVIVAVDGFTALGGAQWIDSPAIGDYGRYLCEDVVGFVDGRFPTLARPAHRGLAGASSGGLGAALWALLRPDRFGGFASHAGDALFEVTLAAEFAAAAQALRNDYGGSFAAFWDDFRSGRPVLVNRTDPLLQGVYAAAAAFSSRPDGTVELPFRLDTGELVAPVFARWLAWDPVRVAAARAEAAAGLRAVWIDAGRDDEYRLDLGAVALRDALLAAGTPAEAVHFELFDGGHRGLRRRLPASLAFLAARLG